MSNRSEIQMMVPTEEFSEALRGVLSDALDDDTCLWFIQSWVPDSVISDEARIEGMYWLVEVLLQRSLMVVQRLHDDGAPARLYPRGLSAQEVVAIVKRNVQSSVEPMDWYWSVWFDLSDMGVRLGPEARLIGHGREYDDIVEESPRVAGVWGSLDEASVRRLLVEACPDAVGGVRSVDTVERLDALFAKLSVGAAPFTPGDRYFGKMFRLDDGTVIGRRGVSAAGDLWSVDLRFSDRSYERCVCDVHDPARPRFLPYRPPEGSVSPTWSLLETVLVRGLSDWVWLVEVDSILAADGVGVDDVPDRVFGLVRELIDRGLAMVGSVPGRLISAGFGYASWELSSAEAVERMRTELLVFGYEAWMWSACFHLTEKGVALAKELVKDK